MKKKLACIILAAGKGTRMKSDLPKPLHTVAGAPMLAHVIETAERLSPEKIIVVIGSDMEAVATLAHPHICVVQEKQNGTGGAVLAAKNALAGFKGDVLVLFGDTPLVKPETLEEMIAQRQNPKTGLVYAAMTRDDPASYGRMILNKDKTLQKIVEFKDANPAERKIKLCNGGLVCADGAHLFKWLAKVTTQNAQGEYYLTDLPPIAKKDGLTTRIVTVHPDEMAGVNSRSDLATVEKLAQGVLREKFMAGGVTLTDPDTVYFSHDTQIENDVTIGPNVFIGTGVTIKNGAEILPFCHLEGVEIGAQAKIGPFARLRPGTVIGEKAKVGNFVEMKKTALGKGAKVNHLSYIGDTDVGAKANVGAGTITCNYDGFDKHQTIIGAEAFIGSNTCLVAPVTVGKGSMTGAGSVITKDIPDNALALERGQQTTHDGWAVKFRARKNGKKGAA